MSLSQKIEWAFSTIGCPELPLAQAAELGRKYKWDLLEVRVAGENFPEKATLRQLAAQKRCRILGTSFGLLTDDDSYREKLRMCAELAAGCQVPYVRIFGGYAFAEGIDECQYDCAGRNLEYFAALELPVRPVLETHDCFSSARRVMELFERLGFTLPVIWDTYHTCFTGGEKLAESLDMLLPYIIDIHIKDGDGSALTLPGAGEFPFAELAALLKERDYRGMICCEHEKMWHPELPELPEAFKALELFRAALME